MRRVRVEVYESSLVYLALARRALQGAGGVELSLVRLEELAQLSLSRFVLGEHPAGGNLSNVGRGEVYLVPETVADLGDQDSLLVANGGGNLVEALLRGDDEPCRGGDAARPHAILAFPAELLYDRPEILQPCLVVGHILADLVDNEGEALPGRRRSISSKERCTSIRGVT